MVILHDLGTNSNEVFVNVHFRFLCSKLLHSHVATQVSVIVFGLYLQNAWPLNTLSIKCKCVYWYLCSHEATQVFMIVVIKRTFKWTLRIISLRKCIYLYLRSHEANVHDCIRTKRMF